MKNYSQAEHRRAAPLATDTKAARSVQIISLIFLLAFLYFVLCMDRKVNPYDEGIILFGANRVMNGDIPHRDFYANYGPAQFYLIALLFKIFGPSVLIERCWDTAVRSTLVTLVFVIADRFTARRLALLAAAAGATWLGYLGYYSYTAFPALAASLASLVFLIPPAASSGRSFAPIIAGACMGVAALFRYDVGAAGFACGCVILVMAKLLSHADHTGWRLTARRALKFTLGFAIATTPPAILFAINGAIHDLIFDAFTFPAAYYAKTRSLPFPTPKSLLIWPMDFAIYIPLLAITAGASALFDISRGGRENRTLLLPIAALILLTGIYFAKGSVRVTPIQLSMSLLVSLILIAVLAEPIPARRFATRTLATASVLLAAVYSFFCAIHDLQNAAENVAWASKPGACLTPPGLERLACFPITPDTAKTIQYIQSHTDPNDPIFVGLSRHDKILANDVLLYFAANRKSATKWHHFDPGLQTSYPIQQEMVTELQQAKPKLIVLESKWANANEPNASSKSSNITLLDDYLKTSFKPAISFGAYQILQTANK